MKIHEFLMVIFTVCTLCLSCSDENESRELNMWIASHTETVTEPVGGVKRSCMMYKLDESANWMPLSSHIEGFQYEVGFEYVLLVRMTPIKKPMQDQSDVSYSLIRILSKKKNSLYFSESSSNLSSIEISEMVSTSGRLLAGF